jgi:glycosyltransferase involved in cell wall biosynthesis
MRIALVAPLSESVPPRLSGIAGDAERVVAYLCRGLAAHGHDVTLFAAADSQAPDERVELISTVRCALRSLAGQTADPGAYYVAQLAAIARRERAGDFDVIHSHMGYWGFPLALAGGTPVVTTLHGRLDTPDMVHVLSHYEDIPLVAVSQQQRRSAPGMHWRGTVHHGLPIEQFRFYPGPGRYLAYLGRIAPDQRLDLAIRIAKASGVPLKIAGCVDAEDVNYFQAAIRPQVDGEFIEFLGEIGEPQRERLLGEALGLLVPGEAPHPFALESAEALACGTPVLARPTGANPELLRDGVTGYVRDSVHELAALVMKLETFDRAGCRAYAQERFSLERMCRGYEQVYERLPCRAESGYRADASGSFGLFDVQAWKNMGSRGGAAHEDSDRRSHGENG